MMGTMTFMTSTTVPTWTLTDRLRKAREHAGFTQAEMADEMGVSRQTIGNLEAGRTNPSKPTLMAWAQVTNVPVAWLRWGHEERRQQEEPIDFADRRNRRDQQGEPMNRCSSSAAERRFSRVA